MRIFAIAIMPVLSLALTLTLITGCASNVSQSNLYWGNYSNTLYKVKKEPGEASDTAHEEELLDIVEESKNRGLKVPPGIYAELGLYALKRGDESAAQNYFRLEQDVYPEGAVLMQQLLKDGLNKSEKS